MSSILHPRDPEAVWIRGARAARRVGVNAQCECGEMRPEAFVSNSPVICAACDRTAHGKTSMDNHHVAGRANSPITIPLPVNDHRAELSPAQYDWPEATRKNPHGSPLLAFAGCVRGFADTIIYLVKDLLLWGAIMLETLDALLGKALGPKWWIGTELEKFAPKSKGNISSRIQVTTPRTKKSGSQ